MTLFTFNIDSIFYAPAAPTVCITGAGADGGAPSYMEKAEA